MWIPVPEVITEDSVTSHNEEIENEYLQAVNWIS